jgi:sugar lactone lactonase YvrE
MEDIVVSVDGLTAWVGESQNVVSVWTRPDTTTNASAWASQTTFGEYGSDLGQNSGLGQLAVTPDGLTVLVSDFGNSRVDIWTRTDTASTEWTAQTPFGGDGTADCQMKQPAGVSMSADGSGAFVADFGNNRITTWKKI